MHSVFFAIFENVQMNIIALFRVVEVSAYRYDVIFSIEKIGSTTATKKPLQGPRLFDKFSITDCMYAPLVFRFNTYHIGVSEKQVLKCNMLKTDIKICQKQSATGAKILSQSKVGVIEDNLFLVKITITNVAPQNSA
ncbi:MAG: glutathione S-transferase [Paraglaciecola sp.]|jgi:glutathione S-transferase